MGRVLPDASAAYVRHWCVMVECGGPSFMLVCAFWYVVSLGGACFKQFTRIRTKNNQSSLGSVFHQTNSVYFRRWCVAFDVDGPSLMFVARFGMCLASVGHVTPRAGA